MKFYDLSINNVVETQRLRAATHVNIFLMRKLRHREAKKWAANSEKTGHWGRGGAHRWNGHEAGRAVVLRLMYALRVYRWRADAAEVFCRSAVR